MIQVNEAGWDRIVRILPGIGMFVLGWGGFVTGTFGVILQWLGFVPLITGLIGCARSTALPLRTSSLSLRLMLEGALADG